MEGTQATLGQLLLWLLTLSNSLFLLQVFSDTSSYLKCQLPLLQVIHLMALFLALLIFTQIILLRGEVYIPQLYNKWSWPHNYSEYFDVFFLKFLLFT